MNPLALLPFLLSLAAAVGDSCSSAEGSGSCLEASSCPGTSFTVKGACPSDGASVLCCIAKSCSTPSGNGNCQNTSNSCSGGSYIAGYCPGTSGIRCCVPDPAPVEPAPESDCTTPRGAGTCKDTSTGCSGGVFISGHCPGGATNVCCVPNPSGGSGGGQAILDAAQTQAGVPYSWGGGGCGGKGLGIEQGAGTVGFDCSGLTQYAVCQATGKAVTLPRTTRGQYGFGPRVPLAERQVGDLIYWATGGDCSCDSEGFCAQLYHTAIEAGGGMMFEAQQTGTLVGLHPYRASNACPFVIRHW